MDALAAVVRQGKALYAGISNYNSEDTKEAAKLLEGMGARCLINQARYSMFDRRPEDGLLDALGELGMGCIVFSPLEQGMLTDRYLTGIPEDSRAAKSWGYLKPEQLTDKRLEVVKSLNGIAAGRGQTLAQMAIAWTLRDGRVTSALIGASSARQLRDNTAALENCAFSDVELAEIEKVLLTSNLLNQFSKPFSS